jgi:hypothetical protein
MQVSLQTGYAPSRISVLQRDPMFQELMEFYRRDADVAAQEVEAQMLLVGKDVLQEMHERVLDGEDIPLAVLNDVFKTVMDRAGFAPVQRSINKNSEPEHRRPDGCGGAEAKGCGMTRNTDGSITLSVGHRSGTRKVP